MRLLVVDDDPALSRALRDTLAGAAYAVDLAATGEDALHLVLHEPYDAVVLDVNLPSSSKAPSKNSGF